ncbi:hypothetical protein GOP47_0025060 [Adiantum capillus-veneris]|uniref:Receptor-like serine/threonine-protein kinase n=1 Tax=Adiantum capillus-veneris TaxID=13818 RepID=A0A9D4Z479_ADICA|nr:hypothetical protein GOP47_0025060 [Adiantum capillus-veneris]
MASVFIWAVALLSLHFPVGSFALRLYAAGNASFIAGQDSSSFWSSDAGNYTFGFKTIDEENYLLSVWHSTDPNRTALWWAGIDDNPILRSGSILNFTVDGSLELRNSQGNLLWSSGSTSASYAQLQDTGNLALLEKDRTSVSWQSLNYPRESIMLSHLQDAFVANKSFFLQSRSNQSSFGPGTFHIATDAYLNLYFHALDSLKNDFIYVYASMNISGGLQIVRDNLILFKSSTQSNELQRLTLDYDGNLRVYEWESNVSSWKDVWQLMDNKCMLGSPCGPFGICKEASNSANGLSCGCPPGYQVRVAGDLSQGCKSLISFNASCGTISTNYSTTMVEVSHSDYNYNDLTHETNVGLNDCKLLCLNDCACMAASYRADGVCFIKGNSQVGYLLNGFASDTNTLLIKVVEPASADREKHAWLIGIGVGVPVDILVVVALICGAWFRRRGRGACMTWRRSHSVEANGPVRYFGYDELVVATHNFNEKLGEGGFGEVYKGWVKVGGKSSIQGAEQMLVGTSDMNNRQLAVAVKLLKGGVDKEPGAGGGARRGSAEMQFRAEVKTLGNIHHVNLVSLLGYCLRKQRTRVQRLLVYEYMENGSLDKFLSSSEHELLPWATRYSIALGAARGVSYLHHECNPPILHCDIKPHNIVLDKQFTAKVADFGFARRFHLDSHITMSGIRGTRGYLAPEWLTSQELTSKVDVFSFGMLLLELVRGFKSIDDIKTPLMEWAIGCIQEGAVIVQQSVGNEDTLSAEELNDTGIDSQEAAQKLKVLKVGMWCIQHQPSMRPAMSRVVQLIDGTIPLEDPPIPRSTANFILPPSLLSDSGFVSSTTTASTNNDYSYSAVSAR